MRKSLLAGLVLACLLAFGLFIGFLAMGGYAQDLLMENVQLRENTEASFQGKCN